jgi:hypothetical protein
MSAQQQPTHHAPLRVPIAKAPRRPSRQAPSRKPSGLRHFVRHTSLSGVTSYAAAAMSVPPASQRPPLSHDSCDPSTLRTPSKMP